MCSNAPGEEDSTEWKGGYPVIFTFRTAPLTSPHALQTNAILTAELCMQRNKIRRKYGISVEEAPLGEFCDGLLLDYCVVQFCPCLSLIQVYFQSRGHCVRSAL